MKKFQIFNTQNDLESCNIAIDLLLGYPDESVKTYRYRPYDKLEHSVSHLWAGAVTDELVDACIEMSSEERLIYYDENNLKTFEWMKENGWFE